MATTVDIGRLFFYVIKVRPGTPPLHTAPTFEVDPPFRRSRSLIVRIPFGFYSALVIGWWRASHASEEEALYAALDGYGIDLYDEDVDLSDPEVKHAIRDVVSRSGLDMDDEWKIIRMLGAE